MRGLENEVRALRSELDKASQNDVLARRYGELARRAEGNAKLYMLSIALGSLLYMLIL